MTSRRLRIAVWDHGRKSYPYLGALQAAGHEIVRDGEADVLLMDADPPYLAHKTLLDRYSEMGAKILLYPHAGGGPMLSYDGVWEPDPRVYANLVTGLGQAEFLRRIGYPSPTHVVGWTFCNMLPFRRCTDV